MVDKRKCCVLCVGKVMAPRECSKRNHLENVPTVRSGGKNSISGIRIALFHQKSTMLLAIIPSAIAHSMRWRHSIGFLSQHKQPSKLNKFHHEYNSHFSSKAMQTKWVCCSYIGCWVIGFTCFAISFTCFPLYNLLFAIIFYVIFQIERMLS